jgi:hypothetical protein
MEVQSDALYDAYSAHGHLWTSAIMTAYYADLALQDGDYATANSLLTTAAHLTDLVVDFVPGLSLAKDAYSAFTGENPVTGEKITATERALIMGSLFLPAFAGGTAKAAIKLARLAKKAANRSGHVGELGKLHQKILRESDQFLQRAGAACAPIAPG